jgi:hypothetical protein
MLDGLFVTPAVTAIGEALHSAHADDGRLAVVGHAKLATALATTREVVPVGMSARAAKKLAGAVGDLASIEDRSLAGVVGTDIATDDDWARVLGTWIRAVRDGGAIVFVDRGRAPEASRRALCAGLTEIEQRHAGRAVVTSGLVTHL